MFRRMIGIFTAVAAALLLVGVAWASGGPDRDDPGTGSLGTTASSSTDSTGTSLDDDTSTSVDDSTTSTSVDDNSTTSITLIDTSTTSTTVDTTTSTSIDEGSTSTTIDDDNREATRAPAPINSGPISYQVGPGGTVIVQIVGGQLVLVDAVAAPGWALEVDKADGREVKIELENGKSDAKFEAKIDNGELRVRVEPS